jgi:hypothetical protein
MNDPPPVGVVGRFTPVLGVMADPPDVSAAADELPFAARGDTALPLPTLAGIDEISGDPDRGGLGDGCGFTAATVGCTAGASSTGCGCGSGCGCDGFARGVVAGGS